MCVRGFKAYLERGRPVGDPFDKRFIGPILGDETLDDDAPLDGLIAHLENSNVDRAVIDDARYFWGLFKKDKEQRNA